MHSQEELYVFPEPLAVGRLSSVRVYLNFQIAI